MIIRSAEILPPNVGSSGADGNTSFPFSPDCCRYPGVLRADAARRVEIGAAENGGDDPHRGQMGSQRRANHADLCPERREYGYKSVPFICIHMHASRAVRESYCEFLREDKETRGASKPIINLDESAIPRCCENESSVLARFIIPNEIVAIEIPTMLAQ